MNALDTYEWAAARLDDRELIFDTADGFDRAVADGFFFLKKPDGFDLTAGDRFAANFYLDRSGGDDDEYRGFRAWDVAQLAEREGYYCREADQVEQFFLEARFWNEVFPAALSHQARKMRDFSVAIIRAILERLDLPHEILEKATGGILSGRGTYHLTFNHFRPHIRARGLNIHKDSGWITMLRSLERGLEVRRGRQWVADRSAAGRLHHEFRVRHRDPHEGHADARCGGRASRRRTAGTARRRPRPVFLCPVCRQQPGCSAMRGIVSARPAGRLGAGSRFQHVP